MQGWISNFVKRYGLLSDALYGVSGSVYVAQVREGMKTLRDALQIYEVSCILNMGETGLFFKFLSRCAYILQTENSSFVSGTEAMKDKNRITANSCAIQIGTKLRMEIVGKPRNPKCFRISQPPVPYFSQKNAWWDGVMFRA